MATALETASLVMVPSGYEDGTLGSLQPLDGTGDFTFTRGSNISATRVNEDGYIERGYENLLLQSNTFSNTAWTKYNLTATGSQEGYDSTNDAWLISLTGGSGQLRNPVSTNGVQTFSVYAKADTLPFVALYFVGSGEGQYFDLENGILGSVFISDTIDSSIESVGNGWYKCSITTNDNISQLRIYPAGVNNIAATSGSIYIQDAMLNQGLVAYPYIETTTTTAKGGILEDMPRLDYSSSRCSLLLEPSRTNLVEHSEFRGNGWGQQQGTSSQGEAGLLPISPTSGAVKYVATAEGYNQMFATISNATTIGTTYTQQGYVKCDDAPYIHFQVAPAGNALVVWDNVNKTIISQASGLGAVKIIDAGNGWTKAEITYTATSSVIYASLKTYFSTSPTGHFIGVPVGTIAYQTHAQVEEGTYPTSYIPTYGVSQTRLADSAIASVTNTTSRTYYIEGSRLAGENHASSNTFYDPADNLGITFWSSNRLRFRFGGQINDYYTLVGDDFKIAISYDGTDSIIYINGQEWITKTFALGNVSSISLRSASGAVSFNETLLFPTALSGEACIELTTI